MENLKPKQKKKDMCDKLACTHSPAQQLPTHDQSTPSPSLPSPPDYVPKIFELFLLF